MNHRYEASKPSRGSGGRLQETPTSRLAGEVGERIAAARERAGLSQAELGAQVGAADYTISRYENGRFLPKIAVLIALSRALGVSTDFLLGLKPDPARREAD